MVGNDFTAGDGGKRPAVFLEPSDDFGFGLEDSVGAGVAARDQAEFGRRKASGVALQRYVAEREDDARIDADRYWHGTGAVELGIGRQVVERPSLDRNLNNAVIAGLGIEGCDKPLAVGAGFRQEPERSRDRPLCVLHQRRGPLQRLPDVLVAAFHVERDGVVQRIGDILRFLVGRPEQLDAENLEGAGGGREKQAGGRA